jgi:protease-4
MIEMARKTTRPADGEWGFWPPLYNYSVLTYLRLFGGDLLSEDGRRCVIETPEARAALQSVVNDTYDWFKTLVRERRRLNEGELSAASTGQVFSGRQGVPLRLVDKIGGERDAVAWLEQEKGIAKDLPVREWRPRSDRDFSLVAWAATGADLFGFEGVAEALRRSAASVKAAQLDGLLAVWHP